ncbi:hypothetical protein FM106_04245 [Brachybacterium faecium]|nr:hypothetical protein FM106_04245 [Brachybacterium faecium]
MIYNCKRLKSLKSRNEVWKKSAHRDSIKKLEKTYKMKF